MPRSRLLLAGAAALLVAVVGAYVAYDQVLSGDSVAPLALPSSSPAAAAEPSASADSSADPPGASAAPAASSDGDVAGTWTVGANSVAGYRVRERLASLSAESDAVGRTSDVTGSITVESDGTTTTLTGGTLTVDTTTITSDEDRRDNRLRTEGLQTDSFPTASFTITGSVEIPPAAVAGTASDITLTDEFRIAIT